MWKGATYNKHFLSWSTNIHPNMKAVTVHLDGLWTIEKHKIKSDFSRSCLFVCLFFIASLFHVNNPIMLIFCKLSELQFSCEKDKQHEMNSCFCFWIRCCAYACICDDAYLCWRNNNIFDLNSMFLVLSAVCHCEMHVICMSISYQHFGIVMSFPATCHFYRWLNARTFSFLFQQ